MSILKLEQHPADTLPWVWDFRRFLSPPDDPTLDGDTIVSASVAAEPVSLIVAQPTIENDATAVRVLIGPGIEKQQYRVTVTIETAGGLIANSSRTFAILEDTR